MSAPRACQRAARGGAIAQGELNPNNPTPEIENVTKDVLEAARALQRNVEIINASSPEEIDASFDRMRSLGVDGSLVTVDAMFNAQRRRLVSLAARYRLPTVFWRREICDAGGLMCYGANLKEAYVQAGIYAGRILQGASAADLPIVQSATFELVDTMNARAPGWRQALLLQQLLSASRKH